MRSKSHHPPTQRLCSPGLESCQAASIFLLPAGPRLGTLRHGHLAASLPRPCFPRPRPARAALWCCCCAGALGRGADASCGGLLPLSLQSLRAPACCRAGWGALWQCCPGVAGAWGSIRGDGQSRSGGKAMGRQKDVCGLAGTSQRLQLCRLSRAESWDGTSAPPEALLLCWCGRVGMKERREMAKERGKLLLPPSCRSVPERESERREQECPA